MTLQYSQSGEEQSGAISRSGRLWTVLLANLVLVGSLVAVGLVAQSVGVLAEGVDYLADAAATAVSLFAVHISQRPPKPGRRSGRLQTGAVAAVVNAGWLLVMCVLVAAEATDRLITGVPEVRGLPVLIVSGVAAVVMVAAALVLRGDDAAVSGGESLTDLSVRAVLLDTVADASAAAGVAVVGGVIYFVHGLFWLDPAAALTIAVLVAYHATKLLVAVQHAIKPAAPLDRAEG